MSNTTSKVITTKAGEALIAQMQAENKVLIIDKFVFANVPNRPDFPQREDTVPTDDVVHESAVHEQGRLTENSVIYSTTLASDVGPFTFNWSGLYCSEHNTLVAINYPPAIDKTIDGPGVTGNTLVRSFVLEYKGIAETTNITVDPESWQYNAHKRMGKMDNDTSQAIIDQNGKDWFIEDGFIVTPQSTAYNIKAGAGYVSGNRIALEFDRIVQVPNKPSFIYVDAWREGTPTGEWLTKFNFVVSAEEKDDYTDAQGVKHFVCKIAQVLADGSVSDLRGKDKLSNYVIDINNLSTISAKQWQPNEKIDWLDKRRFFGVDYLPKKPFLTCATWDEDRHNWMPVDRLGSLHVRDFGGVGDARYFNFKLNMNPTDNTQAWNDLFAFSAKCGYAKVIADSWASYYVSGTLYIPTVYRSPSDICEINKFESLRIIDLQGCEIIGKGISHADRPVCFESAYFDDDGNVVSSAINPQKNIYLTTGTVLENVRLDGFYQGTNFYNWVYGCAVRNIFCNDVAQIYADWSFYCHWEQIIHRGNYLPDVPRYKFKDEANIAPIKGCTTGECDVGFEFSGRVEALRLVDCGIESYKKYGVVTKGQFNLKFDGTYFETNEEGAIGYTGDSLINHVEFANGWGFGPFKMLGDFANNVNVRVNPNFVLGNGCTWGYEDLPEYNLSDFEFSNSLIAGGVTIPVRNITPAANVEEVVTVQDESIGPTAILGKVSQTNMFHPQKVNGKFSDGFSSTSRVGVGYEVKVESISGNQVQVLYLTGIEWSDTQCIYVALRVKNNTDTWTWFGHIYGDTIVVAHMSGIGGITVQKSEANKVVIKSNIMESSGDLGIVSGEIRLI